MSSHWQQPGEEAWRSLSSGTSPLLQLHLPPWDAVPASSGQSRPHTFLMWQVELNSSKALSPRLSAKKRRLQSPGSGQWAATSWPALFSQHQAHPATPRRHREPMSRSGSPARHQVPRKRLQQKYTQHLCLLLSTCTVAQGTCPGVGRPGVRNQHLISDYSNPDKALLHTAVKCG